MNRTKVRKFFERDTGFQPVIARIERDTGFQPVIARIERDTGFQPAIATINSPNIVSIPADL